VGGQPIAMRKKLGLYIVFFLILFLGFYLALRRFIPGFFGEPKALSYLHPFSFTDQEGRRITDRDVAGKVFVAEYFFTTCHGICPEMNVNIRKLSREFAGEPDFCILSHTVDPETDSVARMKRYADSLGVDPSRWFLLTGPKDSLYQMARESYLLDDPRNNLGNINEQFIHTQFVALVDKSGRVRKIYDSLKKDEITELEKDIKDLLKERAEAPRFAHSLVSINPG
jgi:protein SCO1